MPFSTLPIDLLVISLLPILQARLDQADLIHLSLVSSRFSSLLRPILFEIIVFKVAQPSSLERVAELASSEYLASLVETVVFKEQEATTTRSRRATFFSSWLPLLHQLTSLRTIVFHDVFLPSNDFWTFLEDANIDAPKVIKINQDRGGGPLPSDFFLLTGLEELCLRGVGFYGGASMLYRNRSTIRKIDFPSSAGYLNEIVVPSQLASDFPTFPSLTSLVVAANLPLHHFDHQQDALQAWFLSLLRNSPNLEHLSIHTGVVSMRSYNGEFAEDDVTILHTDALPLSESTLLPLFINDETVTQMERIRRLEIWKHPEGEGGKKEWVPFGRKDATEVFDALKGLKGLRELSVTLGEIGEDLVEIIAGVGAEVGLESLEIDLRVGKDEDDASGDGMLWADVLDPLISALSPLAPSLRALVVADNRITNERTSLFHPDDSNSISTSFDFLPTILLFAKHLPKLTSIRWITRDGGKDDEVARDQLWVATMGGGWMRLVG